MVRVALDNLITELNSVPEKYFDFETVSDCLKTHSVEEVSLEPYLFFNPGQPARNLVFKNDLFELLVVCWEIGQESAVQSYPSAKCWITLLAGRLRLQNYQLLEQKSQNRLNLTDDFEIRKSSPVVISPEAPVHQLLNVTSFKDRAVSLHIYSPPTVEQIVYSIRRKGLSSSTRRAVYHSRYGRRDDPM